MNFLKSQIEYHQRTQNQIDSENQRIKDKLQRYEQAVNEGSMVQIPSTELAKLRQQEQLLDGLEKSVERLEASEKSLKTAVEKLRKGKVRNDGILKCCIISDDHKHVTVMFI